MPFGSTFHTEPAIHIQTMQCMYPASDQVNTSEDIPGGPPEVRPSGKDTESGEQWFALRTMYCNDMHVARYLENNGIEVFVALHYVNVVRGSVRKRELEPIVRNLIFARTTRLRIDEMKRSLENRWPVRLFMDRDTRCPVAIPDGEMANFIRVASQYNEDLVYMDQQAAHCKTGDRVRIKCGVFAGAEGKLVRIKGHKRVLVAIEGFVCVATTYIPKEFIQIIQPAG